MGAILDANKASQAVGNPPDEAVGALLDWVQTEGCLVVGGKLKRELAGVRRFARFMVSLKEAGRLEEIDDDLVDSTTSTIAKTYKLRSDDPHVIALAELSGARVLCSDDSALRSDFKNKAFLNSPRGKCFNGDNGFHISLLRNAPSCDRCRRRNR